MSLFSSYSQILDENGNIIKTINMNNLSNLISGNTINQIIEPSNIFYSSNSLVQELTSNNETNINILQNEIKNNGAYEKINDSELKILKTGTYLIQYKINIDSRTNSRLKSLTKLYVDNGSGYQEIVDSRGYGYHRQNSQGADTITSLPRPINLSQNSKVKITAIVDDTFSNRLLETISNSCTLYIWKIQEQIVETINQANIPVITTISPTNTIVKNELYSYQMLVNGVGVTWSLENEPSGMVIDQFNGLITYTPITDGIYNNIIVRASNNDGSDSINFNLTVTNIPIPEQNLEAWFDPEILNLPNNDSPRFWIDRTGIYTAEQSRTGSRPTYRTDIYNKPIFYCDGSEYYNINIPLNTTFSIFIVANSINQRRESFLFSGTESTYFGHDWSQRIVLNYNNNSNLLSYTDNYVNNLNLIHIFRDVSGNIKVNIGAETQTFFIQGANINITSICGSNSDRNKSHEGYFGDLLIYNQIQTGNNLINITNYLKDKYGII